MGITISKIETSTTTIDCGGSFKVRILLSAEPRSGKPGATGIRIIDKAASCFQITEVTKPDKGTYQLADDKTLLWNISELGVKKDEEASIEFTMKHDGKCTGLLHINDSLTYTDNEKNDVRFTNPQITVTCNHTVITDPCPNPVNITIGECKDFLEYDAGELTLDSLGRILELNVRIKDVCPRKRVAMGVVVTELDAQGNEYRRGLKTMVIPAHTNSRCTDVLVNCLKFVLPEELDMMGSSTSICNSRKFRARFITHYIDSDYDCCDSLKN